MNKIFKCPHCNKSIKPQKILQENNVSFKNCLICGVVFKGSKKSKFCSNKCKCINYRIKKSIKS